MNKEKNYKFSFNFINNLLEYLPKQRKFQFYLLITIFISSALLEALNVVLIVPLISIIQDINNLENFMIIKRLINIIKLSETNEIYFYISFLFILITVSCGLLKLLSNKLLFHFCSIVESDVREKIFSNNLYQSYQYHLNKSSAEALSIITQKTHFLFGLLTSFLSVLSSIALLITIVISLFLIEPLIISIIVLIISTILIIIYFVQQKKISEMAKTISEKQFLIIKNFQSALGNIGEIILYSIQKKFIKKFDESSKNLSLSLATTRVISESPRIYLEYIIIIIFAFSLYLFTVDNENIQIDLAVVSLFGFAGLKILPLFGRIYNGLASIKSLAKVFEDIMEILKNSKVSNTKNDDVEKLEFNKSIKLSNISYSYIDDNKNEKEVFKRFNLEIKKNTIVGIKGRTGKGKSTLGKIILCLLDPYEGYIEIDETKINSNNKNSWQNKISLIPQKVFLDDNTILKNITLAVDTDDINIELVKEAAKEAEILEFIQSLPNKFNEIVGEDGVRLSGGQRKRIGIARAFYRNSQILLLDEPTNELDVDTEAKIIKTISGFKNKKTIIMITHRMETLKICDKIIDLDNLTT